MKNINNENVFELLEKIIGKKEENQDIVSFQIEKTSINVITNKKEIFEIIDELNNYELKDASLYNTNCFYVALKSNYSSFYREEYYNTRDEQNKINYSVIKIPLPYFFILLDCYLEDNKNLGDLELKRFNRVPFGFLIRRLEESGKKQISIEEYIHHFFRINVIKIESENDKKNEEFLDFLSSYIFTISYNYRDVFVPHKNILDLFPKRNLTNNIRNNLVRNRDDFDPPRRKYKNELVSHYQMALVSESPYLEYLSYYHVAEYFFDSIIDEDIIKKVKNKITMPDFSYKRDKDIKELIKLINKTTQIKNETRTYDELNALKLTLKKYIDITELKNELSSEYIDFLKNTKVKFSNGNVINLNNTNEDEIYADLSKRIYYTRNALVHSKEMENSKYKPFHDDKLLAKEIPLIRTIAEKLIIQTAVDL